jgi:glycosyltransferase involved in cell wall biosynthesis
MIHLLLREQRSGGHVDPILAVFSPCKLAESAASDGFVVEVLDEHHRRIPIRALRKLLGLLDRLERPVLHTHGYKANVLGRVTRRLGGKVSALVSTSHGMIDTTPNLRFYNFLDFLTGRGSDVLIAPDESTLARAGWGTEKVCVPNALPDRALPSTEMKARARSRFEWSEGQFVAGMLGRLSSEKGVLEFVSAAQHISNASVVLAVAGTGPLAAAVERKAGPTVQFCGLVSEPEEYLAAIDVYVQPSRTEGLSLSLLEAMRAGLPIVATRVGGTMAAVRADREALLIDPRDPVQIAAAIERLRRDPDLRAQLGANARQRFVQQYGIDEYSRAYFEIYRRSANAGSGRVVPVLRDASDPERPNLEQ